MLVGSASAIWRPTGTSNQLRDHKLRSFGLKLRRLLCVKTRTGSSLILYRLGLGRLLGRRFMCLTHTGRRSGKVYRTVLAILRFDERTREIFAVSPWSASQGYRNIQATPALAVETAGVRYAPTQHSLSPEEIAALFIEFRQTHPIFSQMIARIPGWKIDSTYDEFLALARTLRGVAFHP
jgi:deazaflavin-dependent oxidoreductase (nitroreductase family)